jgi:hypothetical protein
VVWNVERVMSVRAYDLIVQISEADLRAQPGQRQTHQPTARTQLYDSHTYINTQEVKRSVIVERESVLVRTYR